MIVDLATTRQWLRTRAIDTSDDTILQTVIDSATALVEDIVGPSSPTTYTETYSGGSATIYPVHQPLISVQSITEAVGMSLYTLTNQPLGQQVDAWGFTVNTVLGVIERRTFGGGPSAFMPGEANVTITYTAGMQVVPPNVVTGTLALIKHIYETTLPVGKANRLEDGSTPIAVGYAVPNFVVEMLQPSRLVPGIA